MQGDRKKLNSSDGIHCSLTSLIDAIHPPSITHGVYSHVVLATAAVLDHKSHAGRGIPSSCRKGEGGGGAELEEDEEEEGKEEEELEKKEEEEDEEEGQEEERQEDMKELRNYGSHDTRRQEVKERRYESVKKKMRTRDKIFIVSIYTS